MEFEDFKAIIEKMSNDEDKNKLAQKMTSETKELLGYLESLAKSMVNLMDDNKALTLIAGLGVVVSIHVGGQDALYVSHGEKKACKKAVELAVREMSNKENE